MSALVGAHLAVTPDSLVALWVNVVRVHCDVGQLPLQTFGFDLLKCCFTNEVSRLDTHTSNKMHIRNMKHTVSSHFSFAHFVFFYTVVPRLSRGLGSKTARDRQKEREETQ